jgi:hypothetical protein
MRLVAVTLAFALLSLGFAPAPFPKAGRQTERARSLREDTELLLGLGVAWVWENSNGKSWVRIEVRNGSGVVTLRGAFQVGDGDVADFVRGLADEFRRAKARSK